MCFLEAQLLVLAAILMLAVLHMALEFIVKMEAQNLIPVFSFQIMHRSEVAEYEDIEFPGTLVTAVLITTQLLVAVQDIFNRIGMDCQVLSITAIFKTIQPHHLEEV